MRILLDTNVLVSALLSKAGPPGQVLAAIKEQKHQFVWSDYVIEELWAVVRRKRIRNRILPEDIRDLVQSMEAVGVMVDDLPVVDLASDPKDNPILATAIAGKADLIVSGDKAHLVALRNVEGIPIVTPREALALLRP